MARWVLATAIAAALPCAAPAKDPADAATRPTPASDSEPFPITVRAAPSIVLTSLARAGTRPAPAAVFTIAGETIPAGQRTVQISIRSNSGVEAAALQSTPDAKGNYRLHPPVPAKAGSYAVSVVAPDGRGKASTTFRAVDPSMLGTQAEAVLNEALAAARDGVHAAEGKVDAQTESPAKDKAKKKLAEARQVLGELHSRSGAAAIKGLIGAVASDPALQEFYRSRLESLTVTVNDTAQETDRVRKLTAEMSGADVGCHQLAFVTEVFKGLSALLNVKKRVLDTSIGLAKDIVSDATANKAKGQGATAGLSFVSAQVVKNLPELDSATKLAGNAASILTDLGAFVTDTLFGMYCEQFVGPVEGIMNARFYWSPRNGDGPTEWWSYNYKITGRVVLYYPKSAKGSASIRLNGRLEGYAHGFETWEDALSVMFPKLMAGAMQHKFNFPPVEGGGAASEIASQGAAPMSAYVEGSAAGLLGLNSFLVSVEGVLEKDAITLVLGPAKKDIDATHRVAVLILSPLTGGLGPQVTWYPLAFQKVQLFLANAAKGGPLKLPLATLGDRVTAQGVFNGTAGKVKAKAQYTLKIKACNPGC